MPVPEHHWTRSSYIADDTQSYMRMADGPFCSRVDVQFDWSTSLRTLKSNPLLSAMPRTFAMSVSSRFCCLVKIHRPASFVPLPVRHFPSAPSLFGGPPDTSV